MRTEGTKRDADESGKRTHDQERAIHTWIVWEERWSRDYLRAAAHSLFSRSATFAGIPDRTIRVTRISTYAGSAHLGYGKGPIVSDDTGPRG